MQGVQGGSWQLLPICPYWKAVFNLDAPGAQMNPVTPLTPQQTAKQEANVAKHNLLQRDAIALDDLGDTVLLGGENDETMSATFARWAYSKKGLKGFIGRTMSRGLNLFQPDHGAKAVAGDLERAEAVAATEAQSGLINED